MINTDIALLTLLVLSNVFWAIQTHRLINKLMTRSLFEYKEALSPKKTKPKQDFKSEPVMDDNLDSALEILS